ISIGAIFDDPISNIKQKLPPYTSHVVRDTSWYTYWEYHPDSGWYEIEEIDEIHWTGVILWDALTFDDWIFPDPTFNGLFPGMTDAEMKETFGITAEDWEREMRMEFE
ncbi:MAG: hypothetical protein GY839_11245, partial [candidate division Zixibacteria bacterium]|nr:hypothetical protein [candidate division Zixibacteria bacterium]